MFYRRYNAFGTVAGNLVRREHSEIISLLP